MVNKITTYLFSFLITVCMASAVMAADAYKKGWDKEWPADCTDPTHRADGTPLDPANNPDDVIDYVTYYVDITPDNITNPYYSFRMDGGCKTMIVDLQQFPTGYWYRYATATLKDGTESTVSVSNPFWYRARPNPPTNLQ